MWPIIVAAAAAGSASLVAKRIFANSSGNSTTPDENFEQCPEESRPASVDYSKIQDQELIDSSFQSPVVQKGFSDCGYQSNCENQDGVFRFSSSGSKSSSGSRSGVKSLRKKSGGSKKGASVEKRSGGVDHGVEQRTTRKKVFVCSKKRKTTKSDHAKEGSLFGWGLSVGIMCMMSAGKAEISRLSATMDETAKVVQELRTKICKRKSTRTVGSSSSLSKFPPLNDDGEYASSVLTEEPEAEIGEVTMDQLEAELESELQKLPLFSHEDCPAETKPNLVEVEDSGREFNVKGELSESHQVSGVSPYELDKKLSGLLIEQQGKQISELENELQSAHSKLNEKEAELQALKDCVKRLTQFSLSSNSVDEMDTHREHEDIDGWKYSKIESESKKPMVG